MTKRERQVKNFSSGLKKLSINGQRYINKLTRELFLVEQSSIFSTFNENYPKLEEQNAKKSAFSKK